MLASLPMYDWPQLRHAHHAYWREIQNQLSRLGIAAPDELTIAGEGVEFWSNPDLIFSQTCGLPFKKYLAEKVQLVGTPDFSVPNCPPGYYCSYFVVRQDDPRSSLSQFADATFAYNSQESQSGFAAAKSCADDFGLWFAKCLQSGAHVKSAQMVSQGDADIAAIDAVSWRFIDRYETFSDRLRILETTKPTPGLPYITSTAFNAELIFAAVEKAFNKLSSDTRQDLTIKGMIQIPKKDYLSV